jgi:DNA-directed RNA polymerase specialized sigma24 family protein
MAGKTTGRPLGTDRESTSLVGAERQNIGDFEGIYNRHNQRVYSLCLRKTGGGVAQGLAKEVLLQLSRKLDTFPGYPRTRF